MVIRLQHSRYQANWGRRRALQDLPEPQKQGPRPVVLTGTPEATAVQEPSIWVHNALASALEKGGQLQKLLSLLRGPSEGDGEHWAFSLQPFWKSELALKAA